MADNTLEASFDADMYAIYTRAKMECDYPATRFHQMLGEYGGVATAKRLLNDAKLHDGFTRLWECGRLDLTVEAVIWDNPRWHSLFNEGEPQTAQNRLDELGYFRQRR